MDKNSENSSKDSFKDSSAKLSDSANEKISFSDINYAIYKIGNWKNSYEINLIGDSNEIPVTEATKNHVLLSMEEIRKSRFDIGDKKVNGLVALAIQLCDKFKDSDIDELVAKEEKEYENILNELNDLEVENPNDSIELENDKFLIYKLEKEDHVTIARPANKFTENHHIEEIKKLQEKQQDNVAN
ncbi:hypothetical protein MBCUT_15800 [Methanobrevibacter cuticularis]|uniref:Uncharacterized protein n=1 Tax=Methanobrevibacter cuticularis TaxID=47311 RepID=A0A166D8C6_9EURY|nr:hypothetical protein [Methanobrevibacter cuticularis]KZX15311.1 hypothetical protein MBCUT_15800 [Methanobrevibacter cuticularis]